MDRATKLLVVVWAAAALLVYVWLLAPSWPRVILLTFGACSAAAALTAFDRRGVSAVLALAYLYPALIGLLHGLYHVDYDVIWIGALLGAIAPDGLRTSWHIPARWRAPLVYWALVVAASTTIVFAREIDFYPRLLNESGAHSFTVRWILHAGLTLLLGILWFDWLCGASLDFHAAVATPLMLSCLGLAAVSLYQLLFDFTFLNVNVFGGTGRASGTMFDANVAGAIAALWTAGAVLWATPLGRWRWPAIAVAVPATWLAVWTSGSRTALASAGIASAFAIVTLVRQREDRSARPALARIAGVIAIGGAIALALSYANGLVVGPARRFEGVLPTASLESWQLFLTQMWDRNRYGTIATAMIADFPWFGVGAGSFPYMLPIYVGDVPLAGDNAQNWYRHQVAEFGWLGSLGWMAWLAAFAWFVVKPRAAAPAGVWAVRGMLIGFAAISLVGMPAQAVSVTITFWTMAFWFVSLVGMPRPGPIPTRVWATVAAAAVVFAAGSAYAAATELRAPVRAQKAGRSYSYGFYYPEPDGSGGEYRWARQRASAVIEAVTRAMRISVSVNHHDLEADPVDVKVWLDGELAIDATLRNTLPVEKRLVIPEGRDRVVIDTWVSRVVHPADVGVADSRELGLMVKWVFLP